MNENNKFQFSEIKKIYYMPLKFISILILSATMAYSQPKILLTDPEIQFEVTEMVNLMYNFNFAKSDSQFQVLKKKHPKHPLPFFLLGYSQFWRILTNENYTGYDNLFHAYMDSVIYFADKMYDEDSKNYESIFFLTAAHAFKGRRYSDLEKWVPATNSGRKALKYLNKSKEYNDFSPEFLFGEGLYNYFRQWIPENFKAFKPVMWFFAKGDKTKGIAQLKQCAENAFYTRVEAQHFLSKIYLFEEASTKDALPITKYLFETYPENPIFHRLYIRVLFQMNNHAEADRVSKEVLKRVESNKFGYTSVDGRYSSFFIAWNQQNKNRDTCKLYYEKSLKYCVLADAEEMNYCLIAYSELAKMAELDKDTAKAIYYYKKIKENSSKSNELNKKAKKFIRKND